MTPVASDENITASDTEGLRRKKEEGKLAWHKSVKVFMVKGVFRIDMYATLWH